MLEQELAFFDARLPEWLEKHRDRVALVKGDALIGFYDTDEIAIVEGARRFGLQPFLVRRVREAPEPVQAPALVLGLLRADPQSIRQS